VYDIVTRSAEFDAIVMGEGGTTLFTQIFGDEAERVAEGAVAPVLVVRTTPVDEPS
jgi:nucleotide-binding universal stress UspA family protein